MHTVGVDRWFVLFGEQMSRLSDGRAASSPDGRITDECEETHDLDVLCEVIGGGGLLLVSGDRPLISRVGLGALLGARGGHDAVISEDHGAAFCVDGAAGVKRLQSALELQTNWIDALADAARADGLSVGAVVMPSPDGAKLERPSDYPDVCRTANRRMLDKLIANGVLIPDCERVWVDDDARVDSSATLLPNVHIRDTSHILSGASIGPDAWIQASVVEQGAAVRYSVIERSRVRAGTVVGPYAHLREGADVGPDVRIGNFVEVKATRLERGVKAGHLAYIGDAQVGENVNIGAGAITCNYDGKGKHTTIIEPDAFIGTNVSLVAPIRIGRGALLAAGSTITDDVPAGARAFGRARQEVKPGGEDENV